MARLERVTQIVFLLFCKMSANSRDTAALREKIFHAEPQRCREKLEQIATSIWVARSRRAMTVIFRFDRT